jgi:nuclear pore complex protein Nup93
MEAVIQSNLQQAQRGGIPGTMSLVEAYLNVRKNVRFHYQDGNYGKHPIWLVMFHCLRIGDYATAATVAKTLQSIPDCAALIGIVVGLNGNLHVDSDKRIRLAAEWKYEMATCRDPYKRAVYAMILGIECPEVNDNIEVSNSWIDY